MLSTKTIHRVQRKKAPLQLQQVPRPVHHLPIQLLTYHQRLSIPNLVNLRTLRKPQTIPGTPVAAVEMAPQLRQIRHRFKSLEYNQQREVTLQPLRVVVKEVLN